MQENKKEISEGKHVEHESHLIEQVMTFSARKPLISFLLVVLITVFRIFGLLKLKIDTSYDSMVNPNNPQIAIYNEVVKEFGSDSLVLIYYEQNDLFSAKNLKIVEDVTYALQDLEAVEKVESLVTTLSIRDTQDGLEIANLISSPPETAEQIKSIQENALYSPLIVGELLSKDGKKPPFLLPYALPLEYLNLTVKLMSPLSIRFNLYIKISTMFFK